MCCRRGLPLFVQKEEERELSDAGPMPTTISERAREWGQSSTSKGGGESAATKGGESIFTYRHYHNTLCRLSKYEPWRVGALRFPNMDATAK